VLPTDVQSYTTAQTRYCGTLEILVLWTLETSTYEVRVHGYPTVSDISIACKNPGSSKSHTRAVRYALIFLTQQLGAQPYGSALASAEDFDVRSMPFPVRG
jgi:hypothetical protein